MGLGDDGGRLRLRLGLALFLIGGVGMLTGGYIMPEQIQGEMEARVAERVSMYEGHRRFETWSELDGYGWGMTETPTHSYFAFHVANAAAVVSEGATPRVEEVGPVVVRAHSSKHNVTFLSGGTVSFKAVTWLELDEEASAESLDRVVTTPNVPYERLLRGTGEPALAAHFAVEQLRAVVDWLQTRFLALAKRDRLPRLLYAAYEELRWAAVPAVLADLELEVRDAAVPGSLTQYAAGLRADAVPAVLGEAFEAVGAAMVRQELADAEQDALYEAVQPVLQRVWTSLGQDGLPTAAGIAFDRVVAQEMPFFLESAFLPAAELALFPPLMRATYQDVLERQWPTLFSPILDQLNADEGVNFVLAQWRSEADEADAWDLDGLLDDPVGAFQGGFELNVYNDEPGFVEPSDELTAELLDASDSESFLHADGYELWKRVAYGDESAASQLMAGVSALGGMSRAEATHIGGWIRAWWGNDILLRDRQREWRTSYQTATGDPQDLDPDVSNTQAGFEMPDADSGLPPASAAYLWDEENAYSFLNDDGYWAWQRRGDNATALMLAANLTEAQAQAVGDWIDALYDTDFYQWALARQWATGSCRDASAEALPTATVVVAEANVTACAASTSNSTTTSAVGYDGVYNVSTVAVVVECEGGNRTTTTTTDTTSHTQYDCLLIDLDPDLAGDQLGLEVNVQAETGASPPYGCFAELMNSANDYALTNAAEGWPRWLAALTDADEVYALSEDLSFDCADIDTLEFFTEEHVEVVLDWAMGVVAESLPVWTAAVDQWRLQTCLDPPAAVPLDEAQDLRTRQEECVVGASELTTSDVSVSDRASSPYRVTNYTLINATTTACDKYVVGVPKDVFDIQTITVSNAVGGFFSVLWDGSSTEPVALANASTDLAPAMAGFADVDVHAALDADLGVYSINISFVGEVGSDVEQVTVNAADLEAAAGTAQVSVDTVADGGTITVPHGVYNATVLTQRSRMANYSCDGADLDLGAGGVQAGWELGVPLGGPAVSAAAAQALWTPTHPASFLNQSSFLVWRDDAGGDLLSDLLSAEERAVVADWVARSVDSWWVQRTAVEAWRLGTGSWTESWLYDGAVVEEPLELLDGGYYGWELANDDVEVPVAAALLLWEEHLLSDEGFRQWVRFPDDEADLEAAFAEVDDGSFADWAPAVAAWVRQWGTAEPHPLVRTQLLDSWVAGDRPLCNALFGEDAQYEDDDEVVCSDAFALNYSSSVVVGDDLASLWDRDNNETGLLTEGGYAYWLSAPPSSFDDALDQHIAAWLRQWSSSELVRHAVRTAWRGGDDAGIVDLSDRLEGEQDGFAAAGLDGMTSTHAAMLWDADFEYSFLHAEGLAVWEAACEGELPRSSFLAPEGPAWEPQRTSQTASAHARELLANATNTEPFCDPLVMLPTYVATLSVSQAGSGSVTLTLGNETTAALATPFNASVLAEAVGALPSVVSSLVSGSGVVVEANSSWAAVAVEVDVVVGAPENETALSVNASLSDFGPGDGVAVRSTCPAPNGMSDGVIEAVAAWVVGWGDHDLAALAMADDWWGSDWGEVRAELLLGLWDPAFAASPLNGTGFHAWRDANATATRQWLADATDESAAACPRNRTEVVSVEVVVSTTSEAEAEVEVEVTVSSSNEFVDPETSLTATNVTSTWLHWDVRNASAPELLNRTVVRQTLYHCPGPDGLSLAQVELVAEWLQDWRDASAAHLAYVQEELWLAHDTSWALPFAGVEWLSEPCTLCDLDAVLGWPLAEVLPAAALDSYALRSWVGNEGAPPAAADVGGTLFNSSSPYSVLTAEGVAHWRGDNASGSAVGLWLQSWAVHEITTEAVQTLWRQGEGCTDLVPGTVGCQGGFELSETGPVSLGGGKTSDVGASLAADILDPAHELSLFSTDGLATWLASLDGCSTVDAATALCTDAEDGDYNSVASASASRSALTSGLSGLHLRHVGYIVDTWLLAWLDSFALESALLADFGTSTLQELPLVQLANATLTEGAAATGGVFGLSSAASRNLSTHLWTRDWSDEAGAVADRPFDGHGFPGRVEVETLGVLDLGAIEWLVASLTSEVALSAGTKAALSEQAQIARYQVRGEAELLAQALIEQPYESRVDCEALMEALYLQPGSVGVTDSVYCSRNNGGYWLTGLGISVAAAREMRAYLLHLATVFAFEAVGGGLFVEATLGELFFDGYTDAVAQLALDSGMQAVPTLTSWAASTPLGNASLEAWIADAPSRRCGSGDGSAFSVYSDLVGEYLVWDDERSGVEGTDGTQVQPRYAGERFGSDLQPLSEVDVWWRDVSQPATLGFERELLRFGVDVRRYVYASDELIDVSALTNASLLYSAPHFLLGGGAAEGSGVDGLAPSAYHHQSYVDVEPMTGQAVSLRQRGQLSLAVQPRAVWHPNATAAAVPVLWTEVRKVSTQSDADDFNDDIGYWYNLSVKLQVAALFIGALIAFFGLALLAYHLYLWVPKEEVLPPLSVLPPVPASASNSRPGSAAVAPLPGPSTRVGTAFKVGPSGQNIRKSSAVLPQQASS